MLPKALFLLLLLFALTSADADAQYPVSLGKTINTPYDELNPVISADGKYLYFVRKNHPDNTYGAEDSEDIWYSTAVSPYAWSRARRLANLNTARYNSVLDISNDDQRMLINGVFHAADGQFRRRGLSVATRQADGEIGVPQPLKIKGLDLINRGLNTTGTWNSKEDVIILAFSEQYMSEQFDLYLITKKTDGTWSKPSKIEALCSSASDESPCLSLDDKTLYFASKRQEKGTEIYESKRLDSTWQHWSDPVLSQLPVHTKGDDARIDFDRENMTAYLCSNINPKNGFDIFRMDLLGRPDSVTISGKLLDEETKQPLQGPFTLKVNGKSVDSLVAFVPDSGIFRIRLPSHAQVEIVTHIPKTLPVVHTIRTDYSDIKLELPQPFLSDCGEKERKGEEKEEEELSDKNNPDIKEEGNGISIKQDAETGQTTGFIFSHILFPYNEAVILPSSQPNLDYLLHFLQSNPKTRVQVEGHTSGEGGHQYNKELSLKRAVAVKEYLTAHGIASSRLKTKGFGPDRPLADNSTEAGREKNRRVEVNIID